MFEITLDNAIIVLTVVDTGNAELWNELIQKGDLKSVCEMAKAFEIPREENDMIKGSECKDKDQRVCANNYSKVSKITRPGWYRVRNSVQNEGTGNRTTKKSDCIGCGIRIPPHPCKGKEVPDM